MHKIFFSYIVLIHWWSQFMNMTIKFIYSELIRHVIGCCSCYITIFRNNIVKIPIDMKFIMDCIFSFLSSRVESGWETNELVASWLRSNIANILFYVNVIHTILNVLLEHNFFSLEPESHSKHYTYVS